MGKVRLWDHLHLRVVRVLAEVDVRLRALGVDLPLTTRRSRSAMTIVATAGASGSSTRLVMTLPPFSRMSRTRMRDPTTRTARTAGARDRRREKSVKQAVIAHAG